MGELDHLVAPPGLAQGNGKGVNRKKGRSILGGLFSKMRVARGRGNDEKQDQGR